ncbi:N-acetylglucosamine kinase [Ammoniphilus sp. YIM 78166]|uniref:N-acetylglucosamine kinase n=1 Tax=Ammoniphilus sp. YIM 78166 TaxID=1644106 RepID=UPI00106F4458|nr:BadF/BadG/BcrA/BcrD ATPase family protein [Ammoniphilus sp. YIM 78166]
MRYIMGVDAGGSKTYTVITDEQGNTLGEGLSAGGNHEVFGLEKALTHVKESIEQALAKAQLRYVDISFVQYGFAGADRESDFLILQPALFNLFPFGSWNLVCDALVGLRLGSPSHTGVVLICGSGTNAVGRSKEGKVVQTGGQGYLYGDAAGGKKMALETFRSAVRSWDYREIPSVLTDLVPKFFEFKNMEEMLNHFLDREVKEVPGQLTLILHEAADLGDELAIRILRNTGYELGISANSVIKRLGLSSEEDIPVVLIGSVLQQGKNPYLLGTMRETILQENKKAHLVTPSVEPVYGAILLGMDHLKIPVGPEIYRKFDLYGGVAGEKR